MSINGLLVGPLRMDMSTLRTELKSDIGALRTELKSQLDAQRTELGSKLDRVLDSIQLYSKESAYMQGQMSILINKSEGR